jgi:hypothetical protein
MWILVRSGQVREYLKLYSTPFQGEFGRFKITWEAARLKLPTKRELGKKGAQLTKLINQPMTEVSDSV